MIVLIGKYSIYRGTGKIFIQFQIHVVAYIKAAIDLLCLYMYDCFVIPLDEGTVLAPKACV